jgi:hypothetical protein
MIINIILLSIFLSGCDDDDDEHNKKNSIQTKLKNNLVRACVETVTNSLVNDEDEEA